MKTLRLCRTLSGWWLIGTAVALLLARAALGETGAEPSTGDTVLTNISQIWGLPPGVREKPHRIRTEVVLYLFDTEWRNASGECGGTPVWLPIIDCPLSLKAGQRIAIDGVIIPASQRFLWDQTRVRVIEENVPRKPEVVADIGKSPRELKDHLVSVEGLIDGQLDNPTHHMLVFLSGNTAAMVYVPKAPAAAPPPFKDGDFIRIKAVFAPQFDRDGRMSDLSLWVASLADVEVIGSLSTDERFNRPIVQSTDIREYTPRNELVHVQGVVRTHEPGKSVTIWDDSGQLLIEGKQTQPLRAGDRIEAVGFPYAIGVQQTLREALYRTVPTNEVTETALMAARQSRLRLAEQVRDLAPSEANRHLAVSLRAIVTWFHPNGSFAYVQDASGGIRLEAPTWDAKDSTKPGTIVLLEGATSVGDFVPVVTNVTVRRIGWWNLEPGKLVTLEEALTGLEDGRWVEMRGYVRSVLRTNQMVRLELSTSGGQFGAMVPDTTAKDNLKGTILRVQGVCSVIANARHQLTGIQVWVPDERYIRVEEPAPVDPFAAPFRALGDLRRFNEHNALNQRVRTTGTLVLQAPGQYLRLQDGADSLFALTEQTDLLQPGDRVEVVGFSGTAGGRFRLREAMYRKVGPGSEPMPVALSSFRSLEPDFEGLLARAQGRLLNVLEKDGEARLFLGSDGSTFEAVMQLGRGGAITNQLPRLGSQLALTGVYEVRNDEHGKPQAFLLNLRSWRDVRVLQQPSWWTAARLLWGLLGTLAVFAIALGWALVISRKNALLRRAQAELNASHEELERRVQERTRELASSLSLLSAALESTADGILVVDQSGSISNYNSKFAELWRLPGDLVDCKPDQRLLDFLQSQVKPDEPLLTKPPEPSLVSDGQSFDLLELKDGRIFERYSQPQLLEDRCVGRVWSFRDVTQRKRAEAELAHAHQQLFETSRKAGMAEIATAILHNVGNVLNSVNISASVVSEQFKQSKISDIGLVAAMLREHATDLGEFLSKHPKGRLIPDFLGKLADHLSEEQSTILKELASLKSHVEHIKSIVAAQQTYAKVGGVIEAANPAQLVEDALQINSGMLQRRKVEVVREYDPKRLPLLHVDRHKVMQILINLIRNAAFACEESGRADRRLIAKIGTSNGSLQFCMQDNGVGIPHANLTRIFNHGFTTRKDGHGFGLHSAALAAKELGGRLSVHSEGPGTGAAFTLELPTSPK